MAEGASQAADPVLDRGLSQPMPESGRAGARHDIFISYASKDQELADRIVREIELRGLACWISSRDIKPGTDYQGSIVAALEHAGIVLLLFSHNANLSSEVPKEISLASSRRKPIIPARIEDILPTGALAYQLTHAQFIDLFRNFDNRLNELCVYLAEMLKASGRAEQTARQVANVKATPAADALLLAAIVSAIAIAGGLAGWLLFKRPSGTARTAAAPLSLSAPPGPAGQLARTTVLGYYAALSGPPSSVLATLGQRLGDQVDFYGKPLTKRALLTLQANYMQRWPDRTFKVRTQSIEVACPGPGQTCIAAGIVDFVFRNEQRNAFSSGAESFSIAVVVSGSASAIAGISGTMLSRRNGALRSSGQL